MSIPNRARDSQKVVQLLRSKLEGSSNNILTSKNSNNPRPTKLRNFSVIGSSHYSGFSVKTKCDRYDQYLLDVENLDKVYGAVRTALGVERPEVVVERNEHAKEFEDKVLNDPEFRDKILKQQRIARLKREGNKTESTFSKKTRETGRAIESAGTAGITHGSSFRMEFEDPHKVSEKPEAVSLEILNTRKRLGQYNFDVKRQAGNKISYQVYAYIEKPKIVREKDVKDIVMEDSTFEPMKENVEYGDELYLKKSEENPFVKVVVKEHNPFQKGAHYVPLKDEEIDIDERMKKKWNPPEWMRFTSRNARHSLKRAPGLLNDVVDECDNKLRTTKANNMFGDYNDKKYVENLHNLSMTSNFRQTSFEREYGIALKHPTLVVPEVKLPSLNEKVEEKNRIFGKLKEEEGQSKKKDIKGELKKLLETYQKQGSKALKSQRSSARPRSINRTVYLANRPKLMKEHSRHNPNITFENSPNKTRLTHEDSLFHDEKYPSTFLTQNIPLSKEPSYYGKEELKDVNEEHSFSNNEVSVSNALESSVMEKSFYSTAAGKANMSHDLNQKTTNKSALSKGRASVTKLHLRENRRLISQENNRTRVSQRSGLSHINEDEDPLDTFTSKFRGQSQKETNRSFIPSSTNNNEKKFRTANISCSVIEDRLNKTFTDFMNVKVQADNKFKAALSVLKKDRPISNKIRYAKYKTDKMMFSHIDRFREKAENCRISRFQKNESQRKVYLEIVDYIVGQELNENKLKACYFFLNFVKELLERGDVLTAESFNEVLNRIDDEKSLTVMFLGVLVKVIDKLRFRVEDIENEVLKSELEKHIDEMAKKRIIHFL